MVADEVRKLAERTGQATQDIGGMMKEILDSKTATLSSIDEAVNRVDRGVELATQAGQSIDAITTSAQEVGNIIAGISTTLRDQNQVTQQIAHQVETVASMANQSNAAVNSNLALGMELERVSTHLSEAVSRFKV